MHIARKRFGQNFLHDNNLIGRIVNAINPSKTDRIIEIGPGQGAITRPLIEQAGHITAIELDRDLVDLLQKTIPGDQLTLISKDVLTVDFSELGSDIRIVGNLPYNISTPIMTHLLKLGSQVRDMHFMLQKEVVDRLGAAPATKAYGRLSVFTQFCCEVTPLFDVPPSCFVPRPKVMSAIVRLQPRQLTEQQINLLPSLQQVVKQAFSMRRKTLKNNFKGLLSYEGFSHLDIDPAMRPEQLSFDDYVRIANYLQ